MRFDMPGPVILLGSGETTAVGGRVWEEAVRRFCGEAHPLRIAILETPAGFEPNSRRVAGRIAEFLKRRLGNYKPAIEIIPARRRTPPCSTEDPELLKGLLRAHVIFLGPGSPTYAVRHLRGTLAWDMVQARHRLGTAVVLASAAMVAAGSHALPVYEIFKVGEDPHWVEGLDLLGPHGIPAVFIPHWNNTDGGADLDTSRCFMGSDRFATLRSILPPGRTVIGIDENTALLLDLSAGRGEIMGEGTVTVLREGSETRLAAAERFDPALLGPFQGRTGRGEIPESVWEEAQSAGEADAAAVPLVPPDVRHLLEERKGARDASDWERSDILRQRIDSLGWRVVDTPTGQEVSPHPG